MQKSRRHLDDNMIHHLALKINPSGSKLKLKLITDTSMVKLKGAHCDESTCTPTQKSSKRGMHSKIPHACPTHRQAWNATYHRKYQNPAMVTRTMYMMHVCIYACRQPVRSTDRRTGAPGAVPTCRPFFNYKKKPSPAPHTQPPLLVTAHWHFFSTSIKHSPTHA